jgi:hypothetical protein
MKTEPQPSDREVLAGLVERVTYQNADNGFCIEKYLGSGMIRGIGPVYARKLLRALPWVSLEIQTDRLPGRIVRTHTSADAKSFLTIIPHWFVLQHRNCRLVAGNDGIILVVQKAGRTAIFC